MAIVNPVSYLHNLTTHTAQTDRLAVSGLLIPDGEGLTWRDGVRGAGDYKVTPAGGMKVSVSAGQAYVKQSNGLNGCYSAPNDGDVEVDINPSHSSLNRRDLIIVKVEDSFFTGSNNEGSIAYVPGTAASTPGDPSVSGSYLVVGRVRVNAGVSSISSGSIDDLRKFTAAAGGILKVGSQAELDALPALDGNYVDYNGNLYRGDGNSWVQHPPDPPTLPRTEAGFADLDINNKNVSPKYPISFSPNFPSTPSIVATTQTDAWTVGAFSGSSSGFSLRVRAISGSPGSGTLRVYWFAREL